MKKEQKRQIKRMGATFARNRFSAPSHQHKDMTGLEELAPQEATKMTKTLN